MQDLPEQHLQTTIQKTVHDQTLNLVDREKTHLVQYIPLSRYKANLPIVIARERPSSITRNWQFNHVRVAEIPQEPAITIIPPSTVRTEAEMIPTTAMARRERDSLNANGSAQMTTTSRSHQMRRAAMAMGIEYPCITMRQTTIN